MPNGRYATGPGVLTDAQANSARYLSLPSISASSSSAEIVGSHGVPEQLALRIVAAMVAEEFELLLVLDPLGNDLELETVRHLNDRSTIAASSLSMRRSDE